MPADERVARSVALEQAYVHDVYEQFYDNPRGTRPWPKVEEFLNDLEPGSIVCDIGCGNGKYLNVNSSVYNMGGEKSNRLCELAREKDNEVMMLDNLCLPFRDESLDAVLSIAVVHHLATTERRICALRELARVLRIGGRIIISVWAMEQSHRKFESQDVLVPWRRPKHISTPSLELTSTTTNSEDDGQPAYHAYTQTSDSDSNKSSRSKPSTRKKGRRGRHKGRSIDPGGGRRAAGSAGCVSTPSSSSPSSPNETCYGFVRRAIQKLAGGGSRRAGVHRPWFLDGWAACADKEQRAAAQQRRERYEGDACDCCECLENAQDIPIELRRIDDEDLPQRRQTFPSSQLINEIAHMKSKSMTNIKTNDDNDEAKRKLVETKSEPKKPEKEPDGEAQKAIPATSRSKLNKPRLVKQKKSINEDDADEALDQPTDMTQLVQLPEIKSALGKYNRGGVFKQRSLNEELMSTDRLREKERLRQNIQKQASLNEDLIYHRTHAFENFKDSVFYVNTSKRFQLIKTGFTNKLKNSTTNIEKVTGTSLKNGFVRMFQNWKSTDIISPTIPEDDTLDNLNTPTLQTDDRKDQNITDGERRHSKEDGSDSSKDSSLQSDTSVDSEDSFASVIFVPKSDPMSPANLSPDPASPRLKTVPIITGTSMSNSPRIKQSSCPTSPRIKQVPLALYPLTKQLSSPKPSTENSDLKNQLELTRTIIKEPDKTLAQKYSVQQIPKFKHTLLNTPEPKPKTPSPEKSPVEITTESSRSERLRKIKELLKQKPGFGVKSKSSFPIVRQSSVSNGKVEAVAKPLPKLLALELFNPETDDKDSDSSCVSSPDSVDSVISVNSDKKSSANNLRFKFPPTRQNSAEAKETLDAQFKKVTKPSGVSKKRIQAGEFLNILQRTYSTTDTTPLLGDDLDTNWDEDCQKHLTDFADKLSEKLLQEIDQYQVKTNRSFSSSMDNFDDPYINRLSEELQDLSKLSAEIQKQNEYLARLSASDSLFAKKCTKNECSGCFRTKERKTDIREKPTGEENEDVESFKCETGKNGDVEQLVCGSNLSVRKESIKKGASTDSCDSDKGSSTASMISFINFNAPSFDSNDGGPSESLKDTNTTATSASAESISRCDSGSTASLASCPDWKTPKRPTTAEEDNGSKGGSSLSLVRSMASNESQDSLPTDNGGGEITYHRYYHVFREGELDQLIEKYVENLHVISSYYDHASWCIVAEKVQVWTI